MGQVETKQSTALHFLIVVVEFLGYLEEEPLIDLFEEWAETDDNPVDRLTRLIRGQIKYYKKNQRSIPGVAYIRVTCQNCGWTAPWYRLVLADENRTITSKTVQQAIEKWYSQLRKPPADCQ